MSYMPIAISVVFREFCCDSGDRNPSRGFKFNRCDRKNPPHEASFVVILNIFTLEPQLNNHCQL